MLAQVTLFLLFASTSLLHQGRAEFFNCLNGERVGAIEICNGIANCADASDERSELCLSMICQPNQFKCYYGGCIDRSKVCNKIPKECMDGSDEFNCGRANGSCK
jgi:hypothetical protein